MPDQIQQSKEDFFSAKPPVSETVHRLPEEEITPSSVEEKTKTPPTPTPIVEGEGKKKKPILSKIFIILAIVIILAGLGFLGYKFFPKTNLTKKSVTLVYWGLFEPEATIQQIISDYEQENPGIKIAYSRQNLTQYRERLQERLANEQAGQKEKDSSSPEVPDIFRIHQSWVPMFGNMLLEIPESVYSKSDFESAFYSSASESLQFGGKYVAIPIMVDGLSLFCNVDLFNAEGLPLPSNWSDFKIAAQKLTTRDSEGKIVTAGAAMGVTANVDHWSDILGLMLLQAGVDLKNPGYCTPGVDGANVCPGADALKFFTNFVTTDRVWSPTLPTSTYSFAKGNLAMYFGPSWRVFDIEAIKSRTQSGFQYKIIPVPQLESTGDKKIGWSSYWVEAVSQKSPYQKEAWDFLKYLSSKEIMQKLYQAQSATRLFGEFFSRTDMSGLLTNDHPYASAFITQAPYSKSWYLSSFTSDNGINDRIIEYYKNAVNEVSQGGDSVTALQTAGKGAVQILGQYGVIK